MRLTEQTSIQPQRIDRQAGLIEGVRILGPDSRNGRKYSPRAMTDAARLYEGAPVNIDHPRSDSKDRPVADAFGWIRNVRQQPDGVYGDLHYLTSHPQAAVVAEAAERNPNRLGLSHHAEGAVRMDGSKVIVETVEKVYSVDLVQTPATNQGLFESEGHVKTIGDAIREAGHAKLLEAGEYQAMADKPMKESESDYFAAMVAEVMAGPGDRKTKLDRISNILKAQEMLGPPSATAAPAEIEVEEVDGEKKMEEELDMEKKLAAAVSESLKPILDKFNALLESVGHIKAESDARSLLESSGREVTPQRITALLAVDGSKRAALLESWPVTQRGQRPSVSPPVATVAKYPEDSRQFVAAIRN